MTYQVLARKWRPRDFDALVGQGHVARALINALDTQRLHHAFLFSGTRGVGKTTVARILAKCLNCEVGVSSTPCGKCSSCQEIDEGRFVDLVEVDAASRAKVDETRDLMDNVQFAPARGRYKVYLIDEVHMFSTHSFNALLKTLEEPPPHVKFLLATTDPQKLPVTVLSRCLQFNLKRIAPNLIVTQLEKLMREESVLVEVKALEMIAKSADGSMRDALSLLDQAIAHGAGKVLEKNVREMLGVVEEGQLQALLAFLAEGNGEGLLTLSSSMAEQVIDFESVLQELLTTLQRIAVCQIVPGVCELGSVENSAKVLAKQLAPEDVQLYYEIVLKGLERFSLLADTKSGFEMVLLRLLAFRPEVPKPSRTSELKSSFRSSSELSPELSLEITGEATKRIQSTKQEPLSIEKLDCLTDWSTVASQMSVQGLARELAVNSVLINREPSLIRLMLSPKYEYLNRKSVTETLRSAISNYIGANIQLIVELKEPESQTPASKEKERNENRHRAAVSAFHNDPNVHALRQVFDAVPDNESIRPSDENST